MATADFNGDGILDLVFNYIPDGHHAAIGLMLGKGDGTFGKPHIVAKPSGGCGFGPSVLLDDLNGDGKVDLVYCGSTQIGVQLGKGDGSFGKPKFYSIPDNGCAFSFAAGDFTSDNKTDLLVSYCYQAKTGTFAANKYLLGNGDGTFQKKRSLKIPGGGFAEGGIVAGDFNADGLLDFVYEFGLGGFSIYPQQ